MKFLKGQTETVEKDGIKVTIGVVDTKTQAIVGDYSMSLTQEGQIKLIGYILRNIVEELYINDEKFDPKEIADKADISDSDTLKTLVKVSAIVIDLIFPSAHAEKK